MYRTSFFFLINIVSLMYIVGLVGCNSETKSRASSADTIVEAESPYPGADESLYQLTGEWHSQNSDTLELSELKGKIPVVTMIFTRCGFACPRIVADLQKIENQVPNEKKDKVVFVLFSFDSERDNPQALKEFAKKMKLNDKWLLLHGNAEQVRELSMALDIKYKKQPDGSFSHSNGITLLDHNGAIAANLNGLGTDPKPLIDKLKTL